MRVREAYFLLYDGDCRVCSAFARTLGFLDVRRNLVIRPIQESRDLLGGISQDVILDAAHAVSPDGKVTTGPDAMPTILGALLDSPRIETRLRCSSSSMRMLSSLYGILVEFRGHLSCGFGAPASAARSPR